MRRHATRRRRRRQLRFETLETRSLLAVLGLGVQLREDVLDGGNHAPGAETDFEVQNGDFFWMEVRAEDAGRVGSDVGVIALPVLLSWDPDFIQLRTEIPVSSVPIPIPPISPVDPSPDPFDRLITSKFPFQRFLQDFSPDTGNPDDIDTILIRGGAIPALPGGGEAIGNDGSAEAYSLLLFQAVAPVQETFFDIQLAGSMSFADAAVLDEIATIDETINPHRIAPPVVGDPEVGELTVREFIRVVDQPTMGSLSGYVYADSDFDGVFDKEEFGMPNVTVRLLQGAGCDELVGEAITGPDGWYHFEDLAAQTYCIEEVQPQGFVEASITLGRILPGDDPQGTTEGFNRFRDIALEEGEHGVEYNFGDNLRPNKRMFLGSTNVREEICRRLETVCETVSGTQSNDEIDIVADADAVTVTVNGEAVSVPTADADIVIVDAGGGEDTVTLTGTSADEVVYMCPCLSALVSDNYAVLVVNAEQITADALTGDDLAVLCDSPLDDLLRASRDLARLSTPDGKISQALGFDRVRAVSIRHNESEDDRAEVGAIDFLLDLVGDWRT